MSVHTAIAKAYVFITGRAGIQIMDISKIINTPRIEDVGWREVEGVCTLFGQDEITILGPHSKNVAEAIAVNQRRNHTAALRLVAELSQKWGAPSNARQYERLQQSYLPRIIEQTTFSTENNKDGATVRSANGVPIIRDEDLATFRENFDAPPGRIGRSYVINFTALLIAGYLRATRTSGVDLDYSQLGDLAEAVRSALAKIEAYCMVRMQPEALKGPLAELSANIDEMGVRLTKFGGTLAKEAEAILAMQGRYETLNEYGKEFETKANQFDEKFEALRKSIEERLKLQDARKLWDQRGIQSAWAFYISGTILIVALSVIPLAAFSYRSEILTYMQQMEAAMLAGAAGNNEIAATVSALGRLVMISAPLGFVVWLVRLVVRYNVRSMLLMDDARQRVTMLNTYLFLIEQDAAVKQDRGAILEALFRRAPGHGSDTVEPPHFTDLLRYGQESTPRAG